MILRYSYSLLAPIYDPIVSAATRPMRQRSLARLGDINGKRILIVGVGSGLDIPHLPQGAEYVGVDLTPAMLKKAHKQLNRRPDLTLELKLGNALELDFDEAEFDIVIMHLILAVVPKSAVALQQVQRVLKPGGKVLILDKFLKPGQWALGRRLINIPLQFMATRTDVVFEEVLAQSPQLQCISDEPVLASGWFRQILLSKKSD